MGTVVEIGPDLYRISIFVREFNLQFNHFLVVDEEPLLFHAGLRQMFPLVRDAVARIIDPTSLRWLAFSHFESDECGALNDWLRLAPQAEALCSVVGAMINVNDFADRPARGVGDGQAFSTGKYRFRLCRTPHLPHGWDACVLFEEKERTLLCSDLFHQNGDVEALTRLDVVGRTREAIREMQAGVLASYTPYGRSTDTLLNKLAELEPDRLAIMHGSSFEGDGKQALTDLAVVFRETLGAP